MAEKHGIGQAIKMVRGAHGLSQEAFSEVSSRTYMSSVERGLKNPTWAKVAELCEVMQVHPATLAIIVDSQDMDKADALLAQVRQELKAIMAADERK
ncbi:helix-turn-helix domain-containing protein [Achromobacter mucicolens]|uniref:Helix-turn-helix domain-containing protein n=1 Tax=Achromobacter mucicolens TaxID=1389922 RepID=A0ABD4YY35_9BURK|nr:helix-turn-helix transcriptional regulator [Achromobacter mucicolens]MDH1180083.1 helix-turn-helix domain-containing protein [Achromobacter mucicolens]